MAVSWLSSPVAIVLAVAGVLLGLATGQALIDVYLRSRRDKDYPPGPPTLPIIGNLHMVPTTKGFLKFHEWGKKYGSIMGIKLGPANMVILNDYKHVMELFDRRGGIYSSRPLNHIANDIMFLNGTHILFVPYGDSWRTLRRSLHEILKNTAVDEFLPVQNAESTQTIYDLLRDPENYYDHIRRFGSAVILATCFGLRGAKFDSPRVKGLYSVTEQNKAINELGAVPPVDIFPFLKKLPDCLSPWRKWARDIRAEYKAFLRVLVRESLENGKRPDAPDCFLAKMYRNREKMGLDDEHIAHVGGALMEAGSETTSATLLTFLLAMAKNPSVLRKCQQEVDSICGDTRTPTIDDAPHLPYTAATMHETLRWRPVAPAGVPHALTQDDTYEGYFLPKGTIVLGNTWSIGRTDEFANAEAFVPERYLNNKYGIATGDAEKQDDKRRAQYAFGGGRRVCSGQKLAENSLMINMSKLVWAFDLCPPDGGTTDSLDDSIETGYIGGLVIIPKRFPLKIKVRSEAHARTIEKELEELQPFLKTFGD